MVNVKQGIQYWIESAKDDWNVAQQKEVPPYTHRLVYLAESVSLNLNPEQLDLLETITDFNLEARYPDEKFSFKKRCTRDFTEKYLARIEEMKEWLMKKLSS